jgi:F-type H+-transporting ATPase subunit gamma
MALARKIAKDLKNQYLSGATDSMELLYASFRLGSAGQTRFAPFLPLGFLMRAEKDKKSAIEYIYEPDLFSVFSSIVERYLEGKVYVSLLESLTSEFSARMIAMKQATENGEEVLDNLTRLRNKTRQATITRELSEIVGGATVLV